MRRVLAAFGTACLVLALATSAQADVKSRQKSQVKFEGALGRVMNLFGGKAAKEGVVSTVTVKGNRQMTVNDNSGELVDLDEEKVYTIDFKGRSYKVVTFAEMRKQLEEEQAKARKQASAEKGKPETGDPEAASTFEFAVDIKKTGQQKVLNGDTCNEIVMTISMQQKGKTLEQGGGMMITANTWVGPKNAAMREQAEFAQRFVKKLFGTETGTYARDMASVLAMTPGLGEGMARLQKESAQMDGTPLLTTVTFESVATAEQAQARAEQDKGGGPGLGGIAGGLGGMFGRKKKAEDAPKEGQPASGPKTRSTIMTTVTEVLAIETTVAAQDVEIPAGFRQK